MKNLFVAFLLVIFGALSTPMISQAQFEPGGNVYQFAELDGELSVQEFIITATQFLGSLLAGLAILMIVISGLVYMTSAGNEGRIAIAKNMLIYAVVGLVVALLAYVVVNSVANALNAG